MIRVNHARRPADPVDQKNPSMRIAYLEDDAEAAAIVCGWLRDAVPWQQVGAVGVCYVFRSWPRKWF